MASHSGCTSPQDTRACVTDFQVQLELDRIIQSTPGRPRGLHNVWYVFLPPNVDECISLDQCDSNAFGGYHSAANIEKMSRGEGLSDADRAPWLAIGVAQTLAA